MQSISVGELENVATAGGWWSDSGLLLGRWSLAKGFHQSSCCLGGLRDERVFRHAPHFLNTDPTKRLRLRQKLAFKHQSAHFSSLARLTGTQSLLYLLMPTKAAKVCALPKKFFAQPGPDAQWGPISALKYPSAHQVGKNESR